jgi:hypothetical protein
MMILCNTLFDERSRVAAHTRPDTIDAQNSWLELILIKASPPAAGAGYKSL